VVGVASGLIGVLSIPGIPSHAFYGISRPTDILHLMPVYVISSFLCVGAVGWGMALLRPGSPFAPPVWMERAGLVIGVLGGLGWGVVEMTNGRPALLPAKVLIALAGLAGLTAWWLVREQTGS
jgi:hypothetical protein